MDKYDMIFFAILSTGMTGVVLTGLILKKYETQQIKAWKEIDARYREDVSNKIIYEKDLKNPRVAIVFEEHYDSCPHGSSYALTLEMQDNGRTAGLSIVGESNKLDSLEALITPGTRISFPATNIVPRIVEYSNGTQQKQYAPSEKETNFTPDTQHGTKHADRITIMPERF